MSAAFNQWLSYSRRVLSADLPHLPTTAQRCALRSILMLYGQAVEVRQPERLAGIPDPAIFAFNHNNSVESVVVPCAMIFHRSGRRIHFMIDWMYLRIPLIGWIMRQVDPIPVFTKPARWRLWEGYRQAHRHLSPVDLCCQYLEDGKSVGIFPEGTRNRSATTLLKGRLGLGQLVLRSQQPVIPVGIDFPAKQRLGRIPTVGRMVVSIGEALHFTAERQAFRELHENQGGSAEQHARELGREVVSGVMRALGPLCSKQYPYHNDRPAPRAPERTREVL